VEIKAPAHDHVEAPIAASMVHMVVMYAHTAGKVAAALKDGALPTVVLEQRLQVRVSGSGGAGTHHPRGVMV
jgi:hypothetical protein